MHSSVEKLRDVYDDKRKGRQQQISKSYLEKRMQEHRCRFHKLEEF